MAKINLLPWRVEQRAAKKREFLGILALSAIVGVLVSIMVHVTFENMISDQQGRNKFLSDEISQLD
ncbi:MAG: pilus assembly protein PilN, partial [Gammaproteobacteria bacterium]